MKLEDLGEIFVDGRIINLKNSNVQDLEKALDYVRKQRENTLTKMANLINSIQD